MERLETFLEQQEHEHGKGQHTLAGEVGRSPPMPRAENRIDKAMAQLLNKLQGPLTEREVVLHPQGTSRMYLLCTSKRLTTCCRFNGSGAGVRASHIHFLLTRGGKEK